jgi:hypothetical protein
LFKIEETRAMRRGPLNLPLKALAETRMLIGGMTPIARVLLPHPAAAMPIRLTAAGKSSRPIAQAPRRRAGIG